MSDQVIIFFLIGMVILSIFCVVRVILNELLSNKYYRIVREEKFNGEISFNIEINKTFFPVKEWSVLYKYDSYAEAKEYLENKLERINGKKIKSREVIK